MRILCLIRRRQPNLLQQLVNARHDLRLVLHEPVRLQWLSDDVGNAPARVQACVRVLKNHLQLLPQRAAALRVHFPQVAAEKFDVPRGRHVQADQQTSDR